MDEIIEAAKSLGRNKCRETNEALTESGFSVKLKGVQKTAEGLGGFLVDGRGIMGKALESFESFEELKNLRQRGLIDQHGIALDWAMNECSAETFQDRFEDLMS